MDEEIKNTQQEQMPEAAESSSELQTCKAQLAHYKEQYAYLMSDFENHRRREAVETVNRVARAQQGLYLEMLAIVDDFERAFADNQEDVQKRLAGFELIYKNLLKFLEKHGIVAMNIGQGQEFNPEFHEALMHVPQEGVTSGAIVQVLQKGYLVKGNLLRPAQVSVAQ
jgi:molecular chaperone GrpE